MAIEKPENYYLSLQIEVTMRRIFVDKIPKADEIRKCPFSYIERSLQYVLDKNVQNDIKEFYIKYDRCKKMSMDEIVDRFSREFAEKVIKEFREIVEKAFPILEEEK